jgi:hypothetical protein
MGKLTGLPFSFMEMNDCRRKGRAVRFWTNHQGRALKKSFREELRGRNEKSDERKAGTVFYFNAIPEFGLPPLFLKYSRTFSI